MIEIRRNLYMDEATGESCPHSVNLIGVHVSQALAHA